MGQARRSDRDEGDRSSSGSGWRGRPFHNEDDHFNVVVLVTMDGQLREIFYKNPAQPSAANILTHSRARLAWPASIPPTMASATPSFSQATEATSTAIIRRGHRWQSSLTTVANAVSISGYGTPDGFRHVIIGGTNGDVTEVFYREQYLTEEYRHIKMYCLS